MVGFGSLGGRKRIDECQDARERLRVPLWSSEMSKGAGTSRFWDGKGLKDLDLGKGGGGGGVLVEEGGPRHLLLLVCWKRMEGCALHEREGVQAPCDRGCCSAGVTGAAENKPIRKQVPADLPMRRLGWDPGAGDAPGRGGPV